jgi:hypothetical protein
LVDLSLFQNCPPLFSVLLLMSPVRYALVVLVNMYSCWVILFVSIRFHF